MNLAQIDPSEAAVVGALCLVAIVAVRSKRSWRFQRRNLQFPQWAVDCYSAKALVSDWERKVFFGLMKQLPAGFHLCPQVRLADFIAVSGNHRARHFALMKIASLSVDFAVMETRTGRVRLVIELDDGSHARKDRVRRDRLVNATLKRAGIPCARYTPRDRVNITDLL